MLQRCAVPYSTVREIKKGMGGVQGGGYLLDGAIGSVTNDVVAMIED